MEHPGEPDAPTSDIYSFIRRYDMSADRFTRICCLTETGWLESIEEHMPLPEAWVRIYEVEVYQGSPYGRQSEHWHIFQTNEKWTDMKVAALELAYPRPSKKDQLSAAVTEFFRRNGV